MKYVLAFSLLFAACLAAMSAPRIIVDTSHLKRDTTRIAPQYTPPTDSTPGRLVIDPGDLAYQMRIDSVNQAAEQKIRGYMTQLEKSFQDSATEMEIGTLVGTAVLEQQMALLDLQINRAVSLRDTLLLKGLQIAIQELIKNSPEVRQQLETLERELSKP
jgi:hypothetical protein